MKTFTRKHSLQRHIKNVHANNQTVPAEPRAGPSRVQSPMAEHQQLTFQYRHNSPMDDQKGGNIAEPQNNMDQGNKNNMDQGNENNMDQGNGNNMDQGNGNNKDQADENNEGQEENMGQENNNYQFSDESSLNGAANVRRIYPNDDENSDLLTFYASAKQEVKGHLQQRCIELDGIKWYLCVQGELEKDQDGNV